MAQDTASSVMALLPRLVNTRDATDERVQPGVSRLTLAWRICIHLRSEEGFALMYCSARLYQGTRPFAVMQAVFLGLVSPSYRPRLNAMHFTVDEPSSDDDI